MIRFPNIAVLVFLWCVPTLAMGAENITGGAQAPQYTCTDEIGQTPTCKCSGYVDCSRLKKSGKCNEPTGGGGYVIHFTCDLTGNNCSCPWQQKSTGGLPGGKVQLAPSAGVKEPDSPARPPSRLRFNRSQFKGVMSRGLDNLPPPVNPDPEPPVLPAPYPKE